MRHAESIKSSPLDKKHRSTKIFPSEKDKANSSHFSFANKHTGFEDTETRRATRAGEAPLYKKHFSS